MKALLDEVVAFVELPHGSMTFHIKTLDSSRFIAEAEDPEDMREHRALYSKIQLQASDILSANDEVRNRLKHLGPLIPTQFWFALHMPKGKLSMCIEDVDPSRHRVISIHGDWPRDNAKKVAFSNAVANSKYVEKKPYWKGRELYVRLKPAFVHPTQRLATYAALLNYLAIS